MTDDRFHIITDLEAEETVIYRERSEIPLLRYHEPAPGLFIAESARVALRAMEAGYEPVSVLVAQDQLEKEDTRQMVRAANRLMVLEQVENPANVGAIFRNCAALGMDAVLLSKGCADPLYRRAIRVSIAKLDADVIHGPIRENDMIEVGETVELYAA